MLAVPVIKGGIRSKNRSVSIGCAQIPGKTDARIDYSQRFKAANECRGAPSCYVYKRKNQTVL